MAFPNGHKIRPRDRARIQCDHQGCTARAHFCEYMRWSSPSRGIAFYNFCPEHWRTPGPHGDTPEQRASKKGTRA